jgi:hypothetical protein
VLVECGCGRVETLSRAMLETAGVAPDAKILDRQRRLKCWECRWRGRAEGPEPAPP